MLFKQEEWSSAATNRGGWLEEKKKLFDDSVCQ